MTDKKDLHLWHGVVLLCENEDQASRGVVYDVLNAEEHFRRRFVRTLGKVFAMAMHHAPGNVDHAFNALHASKNKSTDQPLFPHATLDDVRKWMNRWETYRRDH